MIQTKSIKCDHPELGLIKVSGENAKQFLQGQLTCNMNEIAPTESKLGAHCNPQGRIISLFRIFQREDSYFLEMPSSNIPIALAALKKYAVFFKAQLQECTDSIPEKNWHLLNITHGIPTIFPETSGKFLPHEINLPTIGAVSFNKGCYTGQEIIARMHYKGKLKTRMVHAKAPLSCLLKRGDDIYNQHTVCGSIIDYCISPNNQYDLLVTIPEKEMTTSFTLDPEGHFALDITR